ncbi:MAG: hypothetical protein IT560_01035 [Alphaproteobacteria bacterium]|nr:hypothetical protein [Alphaproteobacteria bacterium]
MGRYKAAFIIPINAEKFLDDDGWNFVSPARFAPEIRNYFIEALNLNLVEQYLGIERYLTANMQMSVIFDDENQIELINFQVYDGGLPILLKSWEDGKASFNVELFIP